MQDDLFNYTNAQKKNYVQRETANHLFNRYCLDASGSSWDQKHHATSLLKAINTRLPQAVQQKKFPWHFIESSV